MTYKEALLSTIIFILLGAGISLCIRIAREDISRKRPLHVLRLALCYLVFYPFVMFPFFVNNNKKEVASMIATSIIENSDKDLKKTKKELEAEILNNLNISIVISIWFTVMKSIAMNYDKYVDDNMELLKKVIATENRHKSCTPSFIKKFQKIVFGIVDEDDLEKFCVSC